MSENGMEVTSGAALRKVARKFVRCPETGNVYLMRRPNLTDLINCGVLPENFVAKTLMVIGKEAVSRDDELTDKDVLNSEALMRAMLTSSMQNPRIVERAVEDDEVEFYDIPPSDRQYLFKWAKGELSETEIETTTGSTTVGAVESFSASEQSSEPSGTLDSSEQGEPELVGAVGNS